MGAWNVGMRSNDAAGDAIREAHQKLPCAGAAGLFDFVNRYARARRYDAHGILGIAAWMCEHTRRPRVPRSVKRFRGRPWVRGMTREPKYARSWWWRRIGKLILEAIEHELKPKQLATWCEPDDRKGALERFRAKLLGKEYDRLEMRLDDLGIFEQLRLDGKGQPRRFSRKRMRRALLKRLHRKPKWKVKRSIGGEEGRVW